MEIVIAGIGFISALAAVWLGFWLSSRKESQRDNAMKGSLRQLLIQEVAHNARSLIEVRDAYVKALPAGYEFGHLNIDTLGVIHGYPSDQLSLDAWGSQLGNSIFALKQEELVAMYVFYGYVKTVKAASEELHKLSSGAQLNAAHMELGEEVRMLNAIEAAVAAVPKLATEE